MAKSKKSNREKFEERRNTFVLVKLAEEANVKLLIKWVKGEEVKNKDQKKIQEIEEQFYKRVNEDLLSFPF